MEDIMSGEEYISQNVNIETRINFLYSRHKLEVEVWEYHQKRADDLLEEIATLRRRLENNE